ncbi:hypothetical protein [Nonomuraea dietziae]
MTPDTHFVLLGCALFAATVMILAWLSTGFRLMYRRDRQEDDQ